jgi:hypothetical protein
MSDEFGMKLDVIRAGYTMSSVPTCPRCAVLRDAALEGVLPKRP